MSLDIYLYGQRIGILERTTPFLGLVRETAARVRECAASVAQLARAEGWHAPVVDEIVEVARSRSRLIAAQLG